MVFHSEPFNWIKMVTSLELAIVHNSRRGDEVTPVPWQRNYPDSPMFYMHSYQKCHFQNSPIRVGRKSTMDCFSFKRTRHRFWKKNMYINYYQSNNICWVQHSVHIHNFLPYTTPPNKINLYLKGQISVPWYKFNCPSKEEHHYLRVKLPGLI